MKSMIINLFCIFLNLDAILSQGKKSEEYFNFSFVCARYWRICAGSICVYTTFKILAEKIITTSKLKSILPELCLISEQIFKGLV